MLRGHHVNEQGVRRDDVHRIRLAQHNGSINKMTGTVEADETFIGGKARNMHVDERAEKIHGRGLEGKAIVFELFDRETRKVRASVIGSRRKHSEIREHLAPGAELNTDELKSYDGLPEYTHKVVDHAEDYVDGTVQTNGLENFWSLLKRAMKGTYVSVEPFHLFRYLDEQSFRYYERHDTDAPGFQESSWIGCREAFNLESSDQSRGGVMSDSKPRDEVENESKDIKKTREYRNFKKLLKQVKAPSLRKHKEAHAKT